MQYKQAAGSGHVITTHEKPSLFFTEVEIPTVRTYGQVFCGELIAHICVTSNEWFGE